MRWTITPLRLAAAMGAVLLVGCSNYVKRDELAVLHENDRRMQEQIDGLESRMARLSDELRVRFERYDAVITEMQGRVRVDMTAHFGFDEAILREEDKPALDDFARVISDHHPDVLVTVEGFTDPAGSASYNRRLGQRRAEAVAEYLTSAGLSADQVRAVSYGEAPERQVVPGASHDTGMANRRVALVIDYAGRS